MKIALTTLAGVAVIGYGISGIVFLNKMGTRSAMVQEQRELFLYAGITCAAVAALILIAGLFALRKGD
jgi:hypothetical protein